MNVFGIGFLELAVIFLVAFLVMGPSKTIEMARTAGKLIGEVRRSANEMTAAADLTGLDKPAASPTRSEPAPTEPPPPAGAVPTTGTGDGNEQRP